MPFDTSTRLWAYRLLLIPFAIITLLMSPVLLMVAAMMSDPGTKQAATLSFVMIVCVIAYVVGIFTVLITWARKPLLMATILVIQALLNLPFILYVELVTDPRYMALFMILTVFIPLASAVALYRHRIKPNARSATNVA